MRYSANKSALLAKMSDAAPLTEVEIDALFKPLASFKHLVLAVSGGPDSMALMGLCAQWARKHGVPRISVASVDHGFRAEARDEVELVAQQAEKLGLECYRLKREGEAPATGVQEFAREARYDLLFSCARDVHAQALVTAHHADDQAETVLMRLCRGSGPGGLAGMRVDTPRGAVTLLRPFLHVPRARLMASLTALGLPSVADPSNADPRFERVRLRQLAGTLEELGLSRERLILLGKRAGRADAALDRAAAAAFAHHRLPGEPSSFGATLFGEPQEIVLRVIAKALAGTGSGSPVRLERLEDLVEALLAARQKNEALGRTLGGVVFRLEASGQLRLSAEGPRRSQG